MKTRDYKNLRAAVLAGVLMFFAMPAMAQDKKPNIVVIFGDDIGMWNFGAYCMA